MVVFLAGVCGLTAAWLVVVESKQEPEPVLILLPRGMEKTVMVPRKNNRLVMKPLVQEVGLELYLVLPFQVFQWQRGKQHQQMYVCRLFSRQGKVTMFKYCTF